MSLCRFPKRWIIAVLSQFGILVAFSIRVNLSVSIVAMVNSTYVKETSHKSKPECPAVTLNVTSNERDNVFNWDEKLQGIILSAFYFGYVLTQVPGGLLARRLGGKWVFGAGILGTAVLTILTPIAAKMSVKLLIAVRVWEGIVEGVTLPAMHQLIGTWSPIYERTKMASFILTGAPLGTLITYLVSGILCDSQILGGWPSVFYISGSVGVLWFIVWSLVAESSPENDGCISVEEKEYIIMHRGADKNTVMPTVPWKKIALSKAVWALVISNICVSWIFYTFLTCLPSFYKEVLNFSLRENGFASALPYMLDVFVALVCGQVADFLRRGERLRTGLVRKIFATVTFLPTASLLIGVGYIGCSSEAAVAVLAIASGLIGSCNSGPCINDMDIAPTFAGLLSGITNTGGTIAGIFAPMVVGVITENEPTRHQWQKIFYISSAITTFGGIFFLLFGSGEEQAWSHRPKEENDNNPSENEALIHS